jgi:hypothetical protein
MDAIYEMAGFVLLGLITLGIVINISDIARTCLRLGRPLHPEDKKVASGDRSRIIRAPS